MISAMILCGGRGTRLREVTELLPKPMVPVGDQPMVWHIMKSYAAFGVRRFILCLGYKREEFVDYFVNYRYRASDVTLTLGREPEITFHRADAEADWVVTLADTGPDTLTGGRVARAVKYVPEEDGEFFLTYGDGLSDVDLDALLASHRAGGKLLTVTAAHPEARFGEMVLDRDTVTGFQEKPAASAGYVNGGFMVMKKSFVERYLSSGNDVYLERDPMEKAASAGDLGVYRHEGFWQCMDNPREYEMLNALWRSGHAPWTKFWK